MIYADHNNNNVDQRLILFEQRFCCGKGLCTVVGVKRRPRTLLRLPNTILTMATSVTQICADVSLDASADMSFEVFRTWWQQHTANAWSASSSHFVLFLVCVLPIRSRSELTPTAIERPDRVFYFLEFALPALCPRAALGPRVVYRSHES